jgi:hypothetical protein
MLSMVSIVSMFLILVHFLVQCIIQFFFFVSHYHHLTLWPVHRLIGRLGKNYRSLQCLFCYRLLLSLITIAYYYRSLLSLIAIAYPCRPLYSISQNIIMHWKNDKMIKWSKYHIPINHHLSSNVQ